MITLYFNSNYPQDYSGNLYEKFDNLMCKFILLSEDEYLPINKFISTNKSPSDTFICNVTLKNLIDNFKINEKDTYKEHRKKLYSYFTKYPIDSNVNVDDVYTEDVLNGNIEFDGRNADDLFIAYKLGYYFISLPLNPSFSVDSLEIYINDMKLNNINWHGSNTINFIKSIIENHGIDNHYLPLLKYSFNDNNCLMSCSFIDDFKQEQPDLQKFIVDLFAKALDNNLLFPSRGDDNIVKKCEGDNVYELRNHAFGGIRVYFRCVDNKILIGSIGRKSSYSTRKIQSLDIARAEHELNYLESVL